MCGWSVAGLGHGVWSEMESKRWGISNWVSSDISCEIFSTISKSAGYPHTIYYTAGGSSVVLANSDPVEDKRRTVDSAIDLLDWVSKNCPETSLIMLSSAAVYGEKNIDPIVEDVLCSPCSVYGDHKNIVEQACNRYGDEFGIRILIPRLFSVYGIENKKQFFWDACLQLKNKKRIELFGTGEESRDWAHVNDIVRILPNLVQYASPSVPKLNVATGRRTLLREAAEMLVTSWGGDIKESIHFNGLSRRGDPKDLCADVREMKRLGFLCPTDLRLGIDEYVAWFKSMNY